MTKLLNKQGAAALLGVSVRTLDKLRSKGLPYSLIGGQVRFSESDLMEWVYMQQPKPAAPAETQEGEQK